MNRDTDNTTKDLYSIDRQQGNVDLTIDTRLLTEKGRDEIAEDFLKTSMVTDAVGDIIVSDKLTAGDFRSEVQKNLDTYEAVKAEIANDPSLAQALQDPNLTPEQKQLMLNQVTDAVMIKLGYKAYDNHIIATTEPGKDGEQVKGFFSKETGDAYINDPYNNSTKDLITTAGHEASRAMDHQEKENTEDAYSADYGQDLAAYIERSLDMAGYDGGLASINNYVENSTSQDIQDNNAEFSLLDKDKGDNRQFGNAQDAVKSYVVNKAQEFVVDVATVVIKSAADHIVEAVTPEEGSFEEKVVDTHIIAAEMMVVDPALDAVQAVEEFNDGNYEDAAFAAVSAIALNKADKIIEVTGADKYVNKIVDKVKSRGENVSIPATNPTKKSGPVQELEVDGYKDLKKREVVGDNLEHDHIPSAQATIRAEEKRLGRELKPEEKRHVYNNATAVERTKDSHKQGPTYGGKNTQKQIDKDSDNLANAACRDCDSLRQTEISSGKSPADVDEAINDIHNRNVNDLKLYTKEQLENAQKGN